MKNIEILYDVLKASPSFTDNEGNLLKNAIQEAALKMNPELLGLLIKNPETKSMFFSEVDEFLVFDKERFNWVIDSKDFLPSSYTGFKNKIMLTDEKGNSLKNNNDVVLSFPCKDCLLEMDSTKETDDRQEIFFNEVLMKKEIDTLLAPKVMTSVKRYDESGVQETTTLSDKDNLIIKGNNLLAMHSLLPRYKGQIKLMYWDILYNTESDKVPYADSFKHSSWLVMMKNRLEVAKQLLREDGVICLQCDDNEMAYLKVLCDEIFGRQNLINCICIKMSESSGVKMSHIDKKLPKIKEYVLAYKIGEIQLNAIKYSKADNSDAFKKYAKYYTQIIVNPLDDIEKWEIISVKEFLRTRTTINVQDEEAVLNFKLQNAERIVYRTNNSFLSKLQFDKTTTKVISPSGIEYIWWEGKQMLFLKDYTEEYLCDFWFDISTINLNKEGNIALKNGKKPELLLNRLIYMFTNTGDIVLDAYLGSGTTAAVAHKMGRQYIGIEQLDSHMDMAVKRLQGVITGEQSGISKSVNWQGGGNFVYCELAKNSQNTIDKISSAPETDLSVLYDEIKASDFICYRVDIEAMDKEKDGFEKLSETEKRQFLISIIDKNTLYINYADMNDSDYSIDDDTKKFNKNFYRGEK